MRSNQVNPVFRTEERTALLLMGEKVASCAYEPVFALLENLQISLLDLWL